ncbi:MAG TPA: aldehyde dehydrogenase family protein [Geobacterales bacterium]|nr:aldehyde dehydrogenase family protein [Geobacterales bacterium]
MENIEQIKLFIDGNFVEGSAKKKIPVLNPATNDVIAYAEEASIEDVERAIDAARRAFDQWSKLDPVRRARILYKLASLIRDNTENLAKYETLNNGKPIKEAVGDVLYAARLFEYYAGLADKIQGETIPVPGDRFAYTLREPLGVTAHIAPWNFPLPLASRSLAPALAAGNTAILKPASYTPITAIKLAELAKQAGLPNGVLNVVLGPGKTVGSYLVQHKEIDSVTFTGSLEGGKEVIALTSKHIKPVILELGGKNPNIVLPDAKLDKAVQGIINGILTNAGQMCWAYSRLLYHESLKDKLIRAVQESFAKIKLGPGIEQDTQMGPLVSKEQLARVSYYVEEGIKEGAKLIFGGERPKDERLQKGNFLLPTLFDDVSKDMKIFQEEIFGPVLAATSFSTLDEAIELANSTIYGLYAAVWTNDLSKAHKLASSIEAGTVCINEGPLTYPQIPFSTMKQSGLGFEQSIHSIYNYTKLKSVVINLS